MANIRGWPKIPVDDDLRREDVTHEAGNCWVFMHKYSLILENDRKVMNLNLLLGRV